MGRQKKMQQFEEEYLVRIQRRYNLMSPVERRVADFLILNGHEKNVNYNINDLASAIGVSNAAITRFCRSLGFSGFSEFKYYMRRGLLSPIGSNTQINENDNVDTITQKVADLLKRMADNAAEVVDKAEVMKAIDLITGADTIFFIGGGSAGGLAQIAASIFQNVGMKSLFIQDELIQLRYACSMSPKDVIVGISNEGYLKNVLDVMMTAKRNKIPTIGITGEPNSLIAKYSDILLVSSSEGYGGPMDQCAVIMAQITVLNILQMGCAVRKAESLKDARLDIIKIAELKRYDTSLNKLEISRMKI